MAILKARSNYLNPYEKIYNDNLLNRLFDNKLWNEALKRGPKNLDAYIGILNNEEDVPNKQFMIDNYGVNVLSDDYILDSLFNEVYNKKKGDTATERIVEVEDENGNIVQETRLMTDYDYTKYMIRQQADVQLEKIQIQRDQQMKDLENGFVKFVNSYIIAPTLEIGAGALQGVYGLINLIEGIGLSIARWDAEGFREAFTNDSFNFEKTIGKSLVEYERMRTDLRDVYGNATGVGKYVIGISNSIGLMLPSILTAGLASGASAAGIIGSTAASVISKVGQVGYWVGMAGMNMTEKFKNKEFYDTSAWQIVLTESVKAGAQAIVEIGLDKILGSTMIDSLRYGTKNSNGIINKLDVPDKMITAGGKGGARRWFVKKLICEGLHEGTEEVLQDFSDMFLNNIAGAIFKNDAYYNEGIDSITLQAEADSFFMGALTSIFMSGVGHIASSTKSAINSARGIKSNLTTSQRFWYKEQMNNFADTLTKLDKAGKLSEDERAELATIGTQYIGLMSTLYEGWGEERFKKAEKLLNDIVEQSRTDYKGAAEAIRAEYDSYATDYTEYVKNVQEKIQEAVETQAKTQQAVDEGVNKLNANEDTLGGDELGTVENINNDTEVDTIKAETPNTVKPEVKTSEVTQSTLDETSEEFTKTLEEHEASKLLAVATKGEIRTNSLSDAEQNLVNERSSKIYGLKLENGNRVNEILIVENSNGIVVLDDGKVIIPKKYFTDSTISEAKLLNDLAVAIGNRFIESNSNIQTIIRALMPIIKKFYPSSKANKFILACTPQVLYNAIRYNANLVYALVGYIRTIAADPNTSALIKKYFRSIEENIILPQIKFYLTTSEENRIASVPKGLLTSADIERVQQDRYLMDVMKDVFDTDVKDADFNKRFGELVNTIINSAPVSAKTKQDIRRRLNKAVNGTEQEYKNALRRIGSEVNQVLVTPFDGHMYLEETNQNNVLFNSFLLQGSDNVTIDDIVKLSNSNTKASAEKLTTIQENFNIFTEGQYKFKVVDGNIVVENVSINATFTMSEEVIKTIVTGENTEQRYVPIGVAGIKADASDIEISDRTIIPALVDSNVSPDVAANLTLTDLVHNPKYLDSAIRQEIRKQYGYVSFQTIFNYLRTYIPMASGGLFGIAITQDGNYVYTNLARMSEEISQDVTTDSLFKKLHDEKNEYESVGSKRASGKYTKHGNGNLVEVGVPKSIVDSNVILQDTIIVVDKNGDETFYDRSRNVVVIGEKFFNEQRQKGVSEERINNYLRFILAHELTHAIQFANGLNGGINENWINEVSNAEQKKIVENLKKHLPTLFKNCTNFKQELRVANDFYYMTSGEYDGYGGPTLKSDSQIDYYPSVINVKANGDITIKGPFGETINIGRGQLGPIESVYYHNLGNGELLADETLFVEAMDKFKGLSELNTYFKNLRPTSQVIYDVMSLVGDNFEWLREYCARFTNIDKYSETTKTVMQALAEQYKGSRDFMRRGDTSKGENLLNSFINSRTFSLSLLKSLYFPHMSTNEFLNMSVPFVRGVSLEPMNTTVLNDENNFFSSVCVLWTPNQFMRAKELAMTFATQTDGFESHMFYGTAKVKDFLGFQLNDENEAFLSNEYIVKHSNGFLASYEQPYDSNITEYAYSTRFFGLSAGVDETIFKDLDDYNELNALGEDQVFFTSYEQSNYNIKSNQSVDSIVNSVKFNFDKGLYTNEEILNILNEIHADMDILKDDFQEFIDKLKTSLDEKTEGKYEFPTKSFLSFTTLERNKRNFEQSSFGSSTQKVSVDYPKMPNDIKNRLIGTHSNIDPDKPTRIILATNGDLHAEYAMNIGDINSITLVIYSESDFQMTYTRPVIKASHESAKKVDLSGEEASNSNFDKKTNRVYINKENVSKYENLKAYNGTYQHADFVEFLTTADRSQLDENLLKKIDSGKLTRRSLIAYLRNHSVDDYTLQLIAKTIFKNNKIKTYDFLQKLTKSVKSIFAIGRIFTKHPDLVADIIDKPFTPELWNGIRSTIRSNPTLNAEYEMYMGKMSDSGLSAFDVAISNYAGGKFKATDTSEVNSDMFGIIKILFLQHYNGSIRSMLEVAYQAKSMKDGAVVGEYKLPGDDRFTSKRNTVSLDSDVSNTDDIQLIDTISDTSQEKMLDDVIDRVDKRNHKAISELAHWEAEKFRSEEGIDISTVEGRREYEKYYNDTVEYLESKSDDYIREQYREYYYSEHYGIDVTQEAASKPKTTRKRKQVLGNITRMYNELKNATRTRNGQLSKQQKKIIQENSDIFNDDFTLKKEKFLKHKDNATGKDVIPDVDAALEIEERLAEIKEKQYNGEYGAKRKANTIESLNERIEKQKQKIDELKAKQKQGAKVKFVYVAVPGGNFSINANVDCPDKYMSILNTTFSDVAKSSIDDTVHMKKSAEDFYALNDEIFLGMTQTDVDNIIEYILSASPAFTEQTQAFMPRYNTITMYTLAYFLNEDNKHGWSLSEEQRNRVNTYINNMLSTAAATLPANWRAQMALVKGHKAAMQSVLNKYGLYVEDADLDELENRVDAVINSRTRESAASQMQRLKEFRVQLYEKLREQYKGTKRGFLRQLVNFERTMMLSSPGTWIRNITSNWLVRGINRVSEFIGSLLPGDRVKSVNQYTIIGTKISPEAEEFVKKFIVDNGLIDFLGDGLSKYNSDTILKAFERYRDKLAERYDNKVNKAMYEDVYAPVKTEGLDKQEIAKLERQRLERIKEYEALEAQRTEALTKKSGEKAEQAMMDIIVTSILNEVVGENMFKFGFLNAGAHIVARCLSDERAIRRSALEYLKKMMTERGIKPKSMAEFGIEGVNMLAKAYSLAAYEYMHRSNFFSSFEKTIREKFGDGAWFIYKQIMPFASASLNWFMEGIKLSPIGLVNSVIKYIKLEKRVSTMVDKQRQGIRQDHIEFQEYLTRKDVGKGVIGTIGFIIGALLGGLHIADVDDEDGKIKITIGDIRVDVSELFGTSGMLLGMVSFCETTRQQDWWKTIGSIADTFWLDSTFSDIFNTFRYSDTFGDWFVSMPFDVLNMMVPNFLKAFVSMTYNHKIKYDSGALGKLERLAAQSIPGVAYAFPRQIDPYTGEEQLKYKIPFLFEFINKVLPIGVYDYDVSDNEKEAVLLGANHGTLSGNYQDIGQLSADEVQELNRFYGKLNKETLDELMDNKRKMEFVDDKTGKKVELYWNKMSDEQKKSAINSTMSKNASYAKVYVWTQVKGKRYYATDNMFKLLRQLGITKNLYKQNNNYKGFV